MKDEFIVLAPQLPLAGDLWHRHVDEVRALVLATLERHGGDARRMYLTGFSFGANGVFDLALAEPELWTALWAVDPTRVPARNPGRPVWLSFGAVARSQKRAFIAGLSPNFYEDHGDDHVGSARRAYADERIYAWLLSLTSPR